MSIAGATPRLSGLTNSAVDFATMLGTIKVTAYLIVEAILAAIAGLGTAEYEFHRNWNALKQLLSRSPDSAYKARARLLKRIADKPGSTAAYDGNSIATLTARTNDTRSLSISATTIARAMSTVRGAEHARAAARPVSLLRTVRRAAAVGAFATPLMLGSSACHGRVRGAARCGAYRRPAVGDARGPRRDRSALCAQRSYPIRTCHGRCRAQKPRDGSARAPRPRTAPGAGTGDRAAATQRFLTPVSPDRDDRQARPCSHYLVKSLFK